MSKINILDPSIFNKIAAGEVVERPSSVIKETVENSIDAGAKHITIEITSGGIKRIRVVDDGCGIEYDDLRAAFMPHATSKIATVEDLSKIGTLGFRGEALSSIASVAKVTLVSKPKDSPVGGQITIEGGQILDVSEVGCPDGTYITIDDIFYCVPARLKFLKKPKLEESDCTNIVTRLILAHPEIAFKYVVDGKIIYNTTGGSLKDSIYTIYGKEMVDNLVEVNYKNEELSIHITGYIVRPTFTRANRTYQSLFINHRYVINQVISTAVSKAYEPFLMKSGFPVFILNLEFPLDKVDVNVHPNKLDVKFEDSNKIYALINGVISETLYNINHTKTISTYEKVKEVLHPNPVDTTKLQTLNPSEGSNYHPSRDLSSDKEPEPKIKDVTLSDDNKKDYDKSLKDAVSHFTNNKTSIFELRNDEAKIDIANKILDSNYAKTNSSQNVGQNSLSQGTMRELAMEYKIIGTLFDTYILLEQGEDMLVIDQHAGHERILYDKFKAEFEASTILSYDLLVPYILNVNSSEFAYLMDMSDNLSRLGFRVEEFGYNCVKISAVPNLLKDIDYVAFFKTILADIENGSIKKVDMMNDYLARSACRAAVKAHDKLSDMEINSLLSSLSKSNQVLLCPHGRPVVIKVSKKEIEKWFKRIV